MGRATTNPLARAVHARGVYPRQNKATPTLAGLKPIIHLATRGAGNTWLEEVSGAPWTARNSPVRDHELGGFGDAVATTGHFTSPSAYHTDHFAALLWYRRVAKSTIHYFLDNRSGNTGITVRAYTNNTIDVTIGLGGSSYPRSLAGWARDNEPTLLGISYDDATGDLDVIQIQQDGTEQTSSTNSGGGAMADPSSALGLGGSITTFSAFEGSIYSFRAYGAGAVPHVFALARNAWHRERPWYGT